MREFLLATLFLIGDRKRNKIMNKNSLKIKEILYTAPYILRKCLSEFYTKILNSYRIMVLFSVSYFKSYRNICRSSIEISVQMFNRNI